MEQQSYSNHRRYVPGFHFFTSLLAIVIFVLAAIKVIQIVSKGDWIFSDLVYTGILPLFIALVLLMLFWYSRQFAVKAQDRAIRAEEGLRHYILTGKALDKRVTMSQIVALRFAPDEEFRDLVQQAVNKNMSGDDIKKAIKNWKADHHRA